jgi:hypothetical protein
MTSRLVLLSVLALLAGALTACSTATTAPGGGSTAGSGAAAPSGGAASGSDAKTGPFPCNVFSLDEIRAATGYGVIKAQPITAVGKASQLSCEYADASGHSFGILTDTSDPGDHLRIFSEIENTGGPVTGIGDSAWGNQSELAVVFGNDFVQLSDDSDADDDSAVLANIGLDKLKAMVKQVHDGM